MLKKSTQPVLGIGGTFCGWTDDTFSMPFLCGNAPLLHGLNLKKLVEDNFHLPAFMIDDTNAHALAEYRFGSGRGIRRFMSLAMGTGISSGVILDGKLLRFTGGCVGDTGHLSCARVDRVARLVV